MIGYKVECDCCGKVSEYSLTEERIISCDFKQIVQIGYEKLHICTKCNDKLISDPEEDEQLMEELICGISELLQKYSPKE